MKLLIATIALSFTAATASADTIWTYAGNSTSDPLEVTLDPITMTTIPPVNPCGCALTGSLTLNSSGAPVAWNFTDGAFTLTQADSTFEIGTVLFGSVFSGGSFWKVLITGQGADAGVVFDSVFNDGKFLSFDSGSGGLNELGNPGTWSESAVSTAEPGTLALLGVGLAGLVLRKSRKPAISCDWETLA